MWFRNLRAFRLDEGWISDPAALSAELAKAAFIPCSASQMESHGWVPPRGNPDELVFTQNRQQLIALGTEQKLLPASVVRQYVQARLEELEAQQGYKPGRGQIREVRDQVTVELLPRAFVKRRLTYVWIDPVDRWLVVDAASSAKADDVVEQIKRALDKVPLLPLRTALSPAAAMTEWLAAGDATASFTVDRDCELRSVTEEKATVRYTRHLLEGEEIRHHLEGGKRVIRLALTWNDRISFVLTEDLHVKRIAFLDVLKEQSEKDAADGGDLFEADFAIMTGELPRFLAALVFALGGEAEA